jgi:hypothetical protein
MSPPSGLGVLSLRSSNPIKKGKDAKCLADLGYAWLDRDDFHEAQLPGIMESLEELEQEFIKNGQFLEADLAKKKLDKLKSKDTAKLHEEFQSRQIAERLGVEEAHMQELQEFNEVWNAKDAEFETHVIGLQQTLSDRHLQAQKAYRDKIEEEAEPVKPKWSKEVLNLQRIQDTLAKQKNYQEAAKIHEELEKIESKEYAMWKAKRDAKLAFLEEQFLTKQQMEMTGLIARIEANRSEHKLSKKKELDRILQRYNNVKIQMESQQKIKYQRGCQYRDLDLDTASVASSRPSFVGLSRPSSGAAAPQRRTPDANSVPQRQHFTGRSTGGVRPSNSTPSLTNQGYPTETIAAPGASATAFAPPKRSNSAAKVGARGYNSTKAAEGKRPSPPIWK